MKKIIRGVMSAIVFSACVAIIIYNSWWCLFVSQYPPLNLFIWWCIFTFVISTATSLCLMGIDIFFEE